MKVANSSHDPSGAALPDGVSQRPVFRQFTRGHALVLASVPGLHSPIIAKAPRRAEGIVAHELVMFRSEGGLCMA